MTCISACDLDSTPLELRISIAIITTMVLASFLRQKWLEYRKRTERRRTGTATTVKRLFTEQEKHSLLNPTDNTDCLANCQEAHQVLDLIDKTKCLADRSTKPNGSLLSLPPELLGMIVILLEPYDQAVLSVCSRRLRREISSSVTDSVSWRELSISEQKTKYKLRYRFLRIIAVGYPGYFICYNCLSLHRTASIQLPALNGIVQYLPCSIGLDRPGNYYRHLGFLHYYRGGVIQEVDFLHAQLIMERHRNGYPYGIALNSLSFIEVRKALYDSLTAAIRVTPCIVRGSLLLRMQTWTIPGQEGVSAIDGSELYDLCPHHHLGRQEKLLDCKLYNHIGGDATGCTTCCHPVLRCDGCGLEFHIAVDQYGPDASQKALVMNAYIDLGSGELLPDHDWLHRSEQWINGKKPSIVAADLNEGCQARFERQVGQSRESITTEMRAMLLSKSYSRSRSSMTFKHHRTQIIKSYYKSFISTKADQWLRYWVDTDV